MNKQEQKAKNIIGFCVIELWNGMITKSELPMYRTHAIAKQETLREIEHRMLNDHPHGLTEDDKEIYARAQKDITEDITTVVLPELGDGHWEIVVKPIWKSTL